MSLLVDLSKLGDEETNRALDHLCKSSAVNLNDSDLWAPHPSIYVRPVIETFSLSAVHRIEAMYKEAAHWLKSGKSRDLQKAEIPWQWQWTSQALEETKRYLEEKPVEQFGFDDWMLLMEWLFQRYLPADFIKQESEWLAVKSGMMGRVQAHMDNLELKQAKALVEAMPSSLKEIERPEWNMKAMQVSAMEYGAARTAENITSMTDAVRHKVKKAILDNQEQVYLGNKTEDLQGALLDDFGELNRDWRQIAVTEAGEMANQGMVAGQKPGTKLMRAERYQGMCLHCDKIRGKVFEVVSAADPDKDGDTQIWAGKTNIGRSSAPRKRVGKLLVPREPHERWWVAAGVQHPNCRGTWEPWQDRVRSDDPVLDKLLADLYVR